jgi:uncharacterized protein YkwD
MALAAKDHCQDIGPDGKVTHRSSEGLEFFQRLLKYGEAGGAKGESISYGKLTSHELVMRFFIDDGIATRKNRNNIINPFLGEIGISTSNHKS